MNVSRLKCQICHNVGNFVSNEQSQLVCSYCHNLMTVYQEELADFMPGLGMRGWRASSQNAFEPVEKTENGRVQSASQKKVKLSSAREVSIAVQLLTNIVALQVSSLGPYLRNRKGVCSTVKEILLCCLYDEEWIKKRFLRYGFRLEVTLAILALACLYHREFLLPCHIAEKATLGEIPYINAYAKLQIQTKLASVWKRTFETRTFPSASSIQKEARALLSDEKHCWPPLRSSIGNFLTSVSGYHDFPCGCTAELAKSMVEYFELPDHFLKWLFPFSICRRISQEKGLEPCGEIDVFCDVFNLVKLSLIYQFDRYSSREEKLPDDNGLDFSELSLSPFDFFKTLTRLKDKKTLHYRLFHNDWYGISDEDVYKLYQLYDNLILGTERVPDIYVPVLTALRDVISHSSHTWKSSSTSVSFVMSQEEFNKMQLEEGPWKIMYTILSEFIDVGLRYLGRENTERLKRYVIEVSDTQLHGILVLMGLVKDVHSKDVLENESIMNS